MLGDKCTVQIYALQTKHDFGLPDSRASFHPDFESVREVKLTTRLEDESGYKFTRFPGRDPPRMYVRTRTHKSDGLSPGISGSTCWCAGVSTVWIGQPPRSPSSPFPSSLRWARVERSLFLGRGAHACVSKGGSRISILPVSALLLVNAGEEYWI